MDAAFLVFLLIVSVLGVLAWKFLLHRRVWLPRLTRGSPNTSPTVDPAGPVQAAPAPRNPKQGRHPRLDLAMGFVPAVQQRQASLHSYHHEAGPALADRPDRVYAEDDMGDLSDPEAGRAVRHPAYSGGSRNLSRPWP